MGRKLSPGVIGSRFGRLIILSIHRPEIKTAGLDADCICDCGNPKRAKLYALRSGHCRSCGCVRKEVARAWATGNKFRVTHGATTRASDKRAEYVIWKGMVQRCTNPHHRAFRLYGAAGISVCERWRDFENFISDMGPRPSPKHSLDRINNDGNYEPGNVKWATAKEQTRNTKSNVWITFNGETLIHKDWANRLGINNVTLAMRFRRGWSVDRAFTVPVAKPKPEKL